MKPSQWRQVEKDIDHLNKEFEKNGSSLRAIKNNDQYQPFLIVDLMENSFPDRDTIAKALDLPELVKTG